MISEAWVWAIVGLPFLGGLINIALLRPWSRSLWRYSGIVTIVAVAGAFVLSLWALSSVLGHNGGYIGFAPHDWVTVGDVSGGIGFHLTVGVLLDPLSAIMAVVVSGVSALVQVYSLGYMHNSGAVTGKLEEI